MRRRPGRSQQARFPGCRGWRWGVGTEPVVGRRVRVNCTAWFSGLPCGDLPGSPGHCAVRRATGRPLGGGSASATRRPSCGPGSARSPGLGLPLARRSLPLPLSLPRPGPRGSRRPQGLGGRGSPRPPTPVQGRPRPPLDPAPPGVPPTRPAARLRHRPAGWIWFQPSLAGLTCAVRGCCGGREVPRSRAHLAAWDAEVSAPGRERAVGAGGRGGPSCRAGRGLGGALETRNRGRGGEEEEGPGPPSPASRRQGPERPALRARGPEPRTGCVGPGL